MSTPSTARTSGASQAKHTHAASTTQGNRTTRHASQQTASSNATTGAGAVAGSDSLGAAQGPQDAFLALLSALGGSELEAGLESESESASMLESVSELDASDKLGAENAVPIVPDPAAWMAAQELPPPWSIAAQLAKQTAQAAQTGQTAQAAQTASPMSPASVMLGSDKPQPYGLVAQTALMDKAAELASDKGLTLNNLAGKSTVARWMGAALSTQASAGTGIGGSSNPGGSSGSDAAALSSDILNMMRSGSMGNGGSISASASTVDFGGYSAAGSIIKEGIQKQELPLNTLSNDTVLPLPTLDSVGSAGSGTGAGAGTHSGSGSAGGQSSGGEGLTYASTADGGAVSDTASLAPNASSSTPDAGAALTGEETLAEQVAFWVNQNRQSAELTLQRDGQPVQVHVQLNGNEAHVTFSSDQAHTRQALDAGMEQLRQLLQEQGLVLTGASVGQRGAGEGGSAQEAQAKNSGREGRQGRATVAISGVAAGPQQQSMTLRPLGAATGTRSLDLFV